MKNKHVKLAINVFNSFMAKCGGVDTPAQRKIKQKVVRSFQNWIDENADQEDDIRIKFCLKGPKGEILKDAHSYTFDEAGMKGLKASLKEHDNKECGLTIHKVDYNVFSADERAYFEGIYDQEIRNACSVTFVNELPNHEEVV
jgi:hypothetical protein